jgi:hypothetical protein
MRDRFRCIECQLLFEGRMNRRGEVVPYDRAGSDPNGKIHEAVCVTCSSTGVPHLEIGDDTAERLVSKIEDTGKVTTPWKELVARATARKAAGGGA